MPKINARKPPGNATKRASAGVATKLYQVRIVNDGGRAGVPFSGATHEHAKQFADRFNKAMIAIDFKARAKVQRYREATKVGRKRLKAAATSQSRRPR